MGKVVRVATYRRISTDEKNQPHSLAVQAERLAAYIKSQAWQHVADYSDQASGTKLTRPGLQQALSDAKRHRFDVLLVLKVDRLSRTCYATGQVFEALKAANVAFVSSSESFDTRTPAGRMFLTMLLGFAEFEADLIKERQAGGIAKAKAEAKAKGFNYGRPQAIPADLLAQLRSANPGATAYQLWKLLQAQGFAVAYSTVSRTLARHAA